MNTNDWWSYALTGGYWVPARDADPRVVDLYRRHYSSDTTKNHRYGIVGPSEKMVLLTASADALYVWRLMLPPEERISQSIRPDMRRENRGGHPTHYFGSQTGVMCSVFRNESPYLSSLLIEEAVGLAWERWPGRRLFTYVWDDRVQSTNPGYCFKMAGFKKSGRTGDGRLTILERITQS